LNKLATRVVGVPQTLYNVGYCYGKLSRVKEAIMVYQAFIQLFPSDALRPLVERNMQDLQLHRL